MSEEEPIPHEARGSSLLNARTLTIVIVVFALLLVLGEAARRKGWATGERKEAMDHCRQIIIGLRLYSPDNSGMYPDWIYFVDEQTISRKTGGGKGPIRASNKPVSSNEVFRDLFRAGIYTTVKDELIFGCPRSPFHPDGHVGADPDWKEALQSGENHWAMMSDMTDSSPSEFPLVFENPADDSMPPRWNTDAAGQAKPGRCWPDRTVLIGFNDGSVRWMPLEAGHGLRKLEMMERSTGSGHMTIKGEVFPGAILLSGGLTHILQVEE